MFSNSYNNSIVPLKCQPLFSRHAPFLRWFHMTAITLSCAAAGWFPQYLPASFILLSYICHTAAILLPYRCHTASIPFSCLSYNVNSGRNAPYRCLCTHPNACAQKRSAKAITARNAVEVVSEYHRIMLIARISSGHAARPGLPRRAPAYLPPDSI